MEIDYQIRRSKRRRKLTITVERDRSVIVHAPMDLSDEKIHQLVESKRLWIYEKQNHPQKYTDLPHPPGKELVSGESALYLGRSYRIELIDTDITEIQFAQRFFIPRTHIHNRKQVLRTWYQERAQKVIPPRVRRFAKKLGVNFNKIKITDTRYRWGSCTVKDNLNFNWRLIKAPTFVIDYVIIHELAHLIEPNHTDHFWNIVATHTPSMEKARTWLKENGQLLEEDI